MVTIILEIVFRWFSSFWVPFGSSRTQVTTVWSWWQWRFWQWWFVALSSPKLQTVVTWVLDEQGLSPVHPRLQLPHLDHNKKIPVSDLWVTFRGSPWFLTVSGLCHFAILSTPNFGPLSRKHPVCTPQRDSSFPVRINFSNFRFRVMAVRKRSCWHVKKSSPSPLWGHRLPVTALAIVSDQTFHFHPRNQDVDFSMLEMFLAFNVLNMTRTDGWIQNFSVKETLEP